MIGVIIDPITFLLPHFRMNRSKHWCFTYNNWTPEDDGRLRALADSEEVEYLVFGYETGASGTPHLQGYVCFSSVHRLGAARALVGGGHLEIKRGTPKQASDYCKKEGLFFESGDLPVAQGSRMDLEEYKNWVIRYQEEHGDVPGEREVVMEWPNLYGRYRSNIMQMLQALREPPQFDTNEFREWQSSLDTILSFTPDDRKILFYVDPVGGQGKSWYQRFKLTSDPDNVQLLSAGKRDDIAHAVDEQKSIFFFNVPRGGMEFMPYTVLEQIKDRVLFSPKYNSRCKTFKKPNHVVVFCNEMPDLNKMSTDRYYVHEFDYN